MPANIVNVPSVGYAPLPIGRYDLEIVESAYEPSETGSGMVLKCKAQIVGGDHDGQPLNIEMALEHENAEAQRIGQRHFAALRRAIGVPNPEHTGDLRFKPFDAQIGVAKGRNIVRAYGEWAA